MQISPLKLAKSIAPQMIRWRRHLHQYPELSFEEFETAKFIRKILDEYKIPYTPIIETGTIAFLGQRDQDSKNKRKFIALRADIDALPITEETNLPFKSKNHGIMHACGHDAHTAMLLATAVLLKTIEEQLPYPVLLIFQPGEEKLPGGALKIIQTGIFDTYPIKAIFAQHLFPELPTGHIGLRAGAFMASTDEIYWELQTSGSHAAQPHLSSDLITTAAIIIMQLQTIISRMKDPLAPSVLSICKIAAGHATNILPSELTMAGTLRTFDETWRNKAKKLLRQQSLAIAKSNHCDCNVRIISGYPALFNSPEHTALVEQLSRQLLGSHRIHTIQPKLWAEDFSYYLQNIPGCFWMLGVRPPHQKKIPGLHNSLFHPDENAFIIGTALLLNIAMHFPIQIPRVSQKVNQNTK